MFAGVHLLKKLKGMEVISWDLQLEFKIEDLWIGAYWRQTNKKFDLWICLLPCIPIHLTVEKVNPRSEERRVGKECRL